MFDSLTGSLISLVIGTLLGSELMRFLYKPRVIIRYKNVEPLHCADGVFWSLCVENLGRTVASQCIGTLTLYDIVPDQIVSPELVTSEECLPDYPTEALRLSFPRDQIVLPHYYRPVRSASLCWAKLGNPDTLDINPGVTQSIDLCKFQKDGYFIFPSEFGWRRVRARVRSQRICGRIQICPSNEFPTLIDFVLSIDDAGKSQFHALRQQTWKHAVARRLRHPFSAAAP
ncbi:MAG TPA: hypothetical protein VEW25_10225 [Allosphingosinicella sp.]|nr:hypothetical protein [Allosphingosinicella sp.]